MIAKLSMRLRELRVSNKLRQDQVANLVGVNKNAISTYENDLRQPSFEILIRLADLYRVSTDYLLGRTSTRSIDLSGLTEDEAAIISELVESMRKKNEKYKKYSP
ncbi:MAG: helix-turn-helix transcriptional regulator [Clostridia bacterium]|nr:helix-turn-helix transcriptional regulator [Clostridia bacterium]